MEQGKKDSKKTVGVKLDIGRIDLKESSKSIMKRIRPIEAAKKPKK
jgi:hypothetical protein